MAQRAPVLAAAVARRRPRRAGDPRRRSDDGVTIHETVPELDAGPIAAREEFPIGPDDDAGAVFADAAVVAAKLLDRCSPSPASAFIPQEQDGVTYADKISPADRVLDLARPAEELVRQVRALSPHIGARADLHGRPVTVWKARVGDGGASSPSSCNRTAAVAWTPPRGCGACAEPGDRLAGARRRVRGRPAGVRGRGLCRPRPAHRGCRAR